MENNLAAQQPEQETAAPVQAESAPATADTPQETAPVTKPEAEKEPEWFVKRIGEMTAKWRADERRAQAAEQELQYLRSQLQTQTPKVDEAPKTLKDFDYDEGKYHAYVLDQAEKRAEQAARKVQSEQAQQAQAARSIRKFQEREVAFEKEAPDYRDVAYTAPISNEVADIIRDLDSGPELAYYLGKNRDIALHLSDLPPRVAAVELGRIDAKLTAEKQAKAAALEAARAAKAVTKAPDPARTIEGSGEPGNVSADEPDSDKLSDAEWLRRRERQVQKRRKA
jgi:hypothetical protein